MSKKIKTIRFIILGVLLVGGIVAFVIANKMIDNRRLENFSVIKNKGRYEIGFDGFEKADGKLKIGGWCFKKDMNRIFDLEQNIIVQVVLKNKSDEKDVYFLKTKRCQRDELDEMFQSELTRKYDGFTAEVSLSKIELEKKDYDLLVYYNTTDGNSSVFGITSDYSIIGGELVKAEEPEVSED